MMKIKKQTQEPKGSSKKEGVRRQDPNPQEEVLPNKAENTKLNQKTRQYLCEKIRRGVKLLFPSFWSPSLIHRFIISAPKLQFF